MHKALIGAGIGLAAALVAILLGRLPFVEVIELKSYDWRMRATADPSSAPNDIVVVTIDEESLRLLEPVVGRWPWPRVVHSMVLDFLVRGKPRVVVYDVLFTENDRLGIQMGGETWTGAESDQALAESAGRLGNVIFTGNAAQEALERPSAGQVASKVAAPDQHFPPSPAIERRPEFAPPIKTLWAPAWAIAHNLMAYDTDGLLRRYVPLIQVDDTVIPSIAVSAVGTAWALEHRAIVQGRTELRIGDRTVPLTISNVPSFDAGWRQVSRALIRFRGMSESGRSPYTRYSFAQLYYSEEQLLADEKATPEVDPLALRDKIVLIGASAPALRDQKAVPVVGNLPGVEVHANVIDNILSSQFLSPASVWAGAALTCGLAVAIGLVGVYTSPSVSLVIGLALAWGAIAHSTWQFRAGQWFPLVMPLLALALSSVGGLGYQYFVEGREKRRIKRLFSRFVSKDVYQQLLKDPAGAQLGGQRRTMTVLFSDIRGFTSVSEQGEPEAIVAQLNEYFSRMVPIVFAHRGTIDKFVGDMIMALFGAPLDDQDHADHAVQTALAMSAELARLNREWTAAGRRALDIGIGINTGHMVAGNLGSADIMSYTVIGDQVNLGARLESLNKDFHTRVIISDATRAALKGRYDIEALGEVVVKGKSVPVKIFSVVPPRAVLEGLTADALSADRSGKAT